MSTLRIAIIGAGNVAESYIRRVKLLREQGHDIDIAVICSRTFNAAESLAKKHAIAWFTTNYQDVLSQSDIGAVVILTPMQTHASLAREALLAGKHLLVEKPLAATAEQARNIAMLAKTNGLWLVLAPHTTLSPVFHSAAQHIAAGDVGEIKSVRGIYGWAGPDWATWFYEDGGGPLMDLGVYALTTLTGLVGPVKNVHAMACIAIPERKLGDKRFRVGTPDNFQVSLDFGAGCLGVLTTGYVHQKYSTPGIELYGTRGTLQFTGQDWDPRGYEIWTNDSGCWQRFESPIPWAWTDGVRDFCEAILLGRAPTNHPSHAIHVLDVINQAMASLRSKKTEPVTSTFERQIIQPVAPSKKNHLIHNPLNHF